MNNKYLYISSRKFIKEYLEDNFENIVFIAPNPYKFQLRKIIKKILDDKISQVILEDYFVGILDFINELNNIDIKVKMVWTHGLATLNEEIELGNLLEVISLLKNGKISSLALTESNIYEAYKHLKNINKISLTVKDISSSLESGNNIGVLGDAYNWQSNYFNQLSAIKLLDDVTVQVINAKNIEKRFCDFFDINYINVKGDLNVSNFRKYINNICVASCVEFSNYLDLFVIDAMNHGIPCILGNNTIFFKDSLIEEKLVVSSDDDINEISNKIRLCLKEKNQILKEYKKLKNSYDKECKRVIGEFIAK